MTIGIEVFNYLPPPLSTITAKSERLIYISTTFEYFLVASHLNISNSRALWALLFCSLLIVGVAAIRFHSPAIVVILLITGVLALFRPKMSMTTAIILLILLYPVPNAGLLTARDANAFVKIAEIFSNQGLPITQYVPGYPSTPLGHFYTFIVAEITGTQIFPRLDLDIYVLPILPMVNVGVIFTLVYIFIRRHNFAGRPVPAWLALAPVVIWFNWYRDYVVFKRVSFGIMLFALGVYLLHRSDNGRAYNALLIITMFAILLTHHIASIMLGLYFGIHLLVTGWPNFKRINTIIIFSVFFFVMFVLFTETFAFFFTLAALLLTEGKVVTVELPREIEITPWLRMQWLAPYAFAGLLGGSFFITMLQDYLRETLQREEIGIFLFSSFAGLCTVVLFFMTGGFDSDRMITYFVIIGGGIGFGKLYAADFGRFSDFKRPAIRTLVVLLVVTSAVAMPLHVAFIDEPNYSGSRTDQRFGSQLYAASFFVADHGGDLEPVGHQNFQKVTRATLLEPIPGRPRMVSRYELREENLLMLADWNDEVYFAKSGRGLAILQVNDAKSRYAARHNVIYENGELTGYTTS